MLAVVYLIFNEGYAPPPATPTRERARGDPARRVLVALMPDEPEALGLLALMLLHDARRATRASTRTASSCCSSDQDRARWDRDADRRGPARCSSARCALRRPGPYQLQAAIAVAARAERRETDWPQIAALYERLGRLAPSPVVELNRAVAVAMAEGPERGLELIDGIDGLDRYRHLHSARADLLRRLGRSAEAATAYDRALQLAAQPAERAFLERRLAEVRSSA